MTLENILLLFVEMLFCHIVDDYYLQGILASMKQKVWWEKNFPEEKYKNDYKVALIEHAFSWSFMISLPMIINRFYELKEGTVILMMVMIVINTVIHTIVDNDKANKLIINLIEDQLTHIFQIIATILVYVLWFII